jgi:hypothetical protein
VSERELASRRTNVLVLSLGLLGIVLLRLPQLAGGGVLLDGDEAIVGLMAQQLREGREVPVFFWGQGYGLATLEAAAGALAFALLGASATSLKIAMLALWAAGWAFFALALLRLLPRRGAMLGALLLATCPAWGAWSTMARGGYVTMFALSGLWLWLFAHGSRAPLSIARLGIVAALVYLAQPIGLLAPAVIVAVLGALALLESGASRLGDLEQRRATRRSLIALVASLQRDGIEHVYCLDAMWQWVLMFESGERVLARWRHPSDRRPHYPRAVDGALLAGRKVAIVGRETDLRALLAELARRGAPQPRLVGTGGMLARLDSPHPDFRMAALLEGLGFALNRR